jgi:hypothetical protein
MEIIDNIPGWGAPVDEAALKQIKTCYYSRQVRRRHADLRNESGACLPWSPASGQNHRWAFTVELA